MTERQDGTEPMTPEVAVMMLTGTGKDSPQLVAEAVAALATLVDSVMVDGPYRDAVDTDGKPMVWHFVGYRPAAHTFGRHAAGTLNPPTVPQYQGVIFADGTCVLRWLTDRRSWSVWDSFDEMFGVHGRPEYGTQIVWPSGQAPAEALAVIQDAQQAMEARRAVGDGDHGTFVVDIPDRTDPDASAAVQRRMAELATQDFDVVHGPSLTEGQAAELMDARHHQRELRAGEQR